MEYIYERNALKPSYLCDVCGTTKVVPCYKAICETGPRQLLPDSSMAKFGCGTIPNR